MKKLMTILGVFLFASLVLTSCGSPEKDGKKMGKCICDAMSLIVENPEKAEEKGKECEEMGKKHEKKYKGNETDEKEYEKGLEEAGKDCMDDD